MICHTYKCIFIHIPKTAGTTIMNAFDRNWSIYTNNKNDAFLNKSIFSPKEEWIEYALCYKDYVTFSVIRNPWDRFISGWKYCDSTKNRSLLDVLQHLPTHGHDYEHITRLQYDRIYYKNVQIQNFLLRFENLQQDFDILCEKIGKPKKKLNHLNKTNRYEYDYYFDTEVKLNLFHDHFKEDIESFNYEYIK